MKLIALPAFADNYIWLLHKDRHALVVDPGDSAPVLAWMQEHPGVELDTILVTHHHADHTQGIPELKAKHKCRVTAPKNEASKIADVDATYGEGDTVKATGRILEVPVGPELLGRVVDPLGNLVMHYPLEAAGKPVLEDLQRLLKVSQIG